MARRGFTTGKGKQAPSGDLNAEVAASVLVKSRQRVRRKNNSGERWIGQYALCLLVYDACRRTLYIDCRV